VRRCELRTIPRRDCDEAERGNVGHQQPKSELPGRARGGHLVLHVDHRACEQPKNLARHKRCSRVSHAIFGEISAEFVEGRKYTGTTQLQKRALLGTGILRCTDV
jgi:hypothetical protein